MMEGATNKKRAAFSATRATLSDSPILKTCGGLSRHGLLRANAANMRAVLAIPQTKSHFNTTKIRAFLGFIFFGGLAKALRV